jgi:hypothetical protein
MTRIIQLARPHKQPWSWCPRFFFFLPVDSTSTVTWRPRTDYSLSSGNLEREIQETIDERYWKGGHHVQDSGVCAASYRVDVGVSFLIIMRSDRESNHSSLSLSLSIYIYIVSRQSSPPLIAFLACCLGCSLTLPELKGGFDFAFILQALRVVILNQVRVIARNWYRARYEIADAWIYVVRVASLKLKAHNASKHSSGWLFCSSDLSFLLPLVFMIGFLLVWNVG